MGKITWQIVNIIFIVDYVQSIGPSLPWGWIQQPASYQYGEMEKKIESCDKFQMKQHVKGSEMLNQVDLISTLSVGDTHTNGGHFGKV